MLKMHVKVKHCKILYVPKRLGLIFLFNLKICEKHDQQCHSMQCANFSYIAEAWL